MKVICRLRFFAVFATVRINCFRLFKIVTNRVTLEYSEWNILIIYCDIKRVLLLLVVEDDVWHPYQLWWNSYRRHVIVVRWPPAKFIVIPLLVEEGGEQHTPYRSYWLHTTAKNKGWGRAMLPHLFQPHVGRHHLVLLILEMEIFSIDSKLSHLNIFSSIFASIRGCEMSCDRFFSSTEQSGRVHNLVYFC